ncbi:unnamed protein product [Leuciscus chuanchicus]
MSHIPAVDYEKKKMPVLPEQTGTLQAATGKYPGVLMLTVERDGRGRERDGLQRFPSLWREGGSQMGDSCPHPNAGYIRTSPDGFGSGSNITADKVCFPAPSTCVLVNTLMPWHGTHAASSPHTRDSEHPGIRVLSINSQPPPFSSESALRPHLIQTRLRSPSHTDPGSGPSHPGHDSDTGRPDFGLKESEKERLSYSGPVRRRVRRY